MHGKSALSQPWIHFLLELNCTRSDFLRKEQFVTAGCNKLLQPWETFQISKILRIHYSIFAFSICGSADHLATTMLSFLHFHFTTQKLSTKVFPNYLRLNVWGVRNNFSPQCLLPIDLIQKIHCWLGQTWVSTLCHTFMYPPSHSQRWLNHRSLRLNPEVGIKAITSLFPFWCLCLYCLTQVLSPRVISLNTLRCLPSYTTWLMLARTKL